MTGGAVARHAGVLVEARSFGQIGRRGRRSEQPRGGDDVVHERSAIGADAGRVLASRDTRVDRGDALLEPGIGEARSSRHGFRRQRPLLGQLPCILRRDRRRVVGPQILEDRDELLRVAAPGLRAARRRARDRETECYEDRSKQSDQREAFEVEYRFQQREYEGRRRCLQRE